MTCQSVTQSAFRSETSCPFEFIVYWKQYRPMSVRANASSQFKFAIFFFFFPLWLKFNNQNTLVEIHLGRRSELVLVSGISWRTWFSATRKIFTSAAGMCPNFFFICTSICIRSFREIFKSVSFPPSVTLAQSYINTIYYRILTSKYY